MTLPHGGVTALTFRKESDMKRAIIFLVVPILFSCSQAKLVPAKDSGSAKLTYNAIGASLEFAREYKTTDNAVNMLWIEEVLNSLVKSGQVKNEADAHSIRQFWAYMLFDKQEKDPKKVTAKDVEMFVNASTTPISDEIEIVPPRQLKANSKEKSQYAIAGKLWSNGSVWKKQIMLYNSATEEMISEQMRQYVNSLKPNYLGKAGDYYKYNLFSKGDYPAKYQHLIE